MKRLRAWACATILTPRALIYAIAATLLWIWVLLPMARIVVPPSIWLEVGKISVGNGTIHGAAPGPLEPSPAVLVERTIHRTAAVSSIATVWYIDPVDGSIWRYCDPGDRPANVYPAGRPYPGRTLDWWLESPPEEPCRFVPGEYFLTIEWTVHAVFGLLDLPFVRQSERFFVYDASAPWRPIAFPTEEAKR